MFQKFRILLLTASLLFCGLAACVSEKIPVQSAKITADTLKIAVLPLIYTGLQSDEQVLTYSSGIRSILSAYLDAHAQLVIFDREKIRREIMMAQAAQFSGNVADAPQIQGADYLILGTYQVKNATTFRGLELRLIKVENGLIIAQKHLDEVSLNAYDLGVFINGFGEIIRQRLHIGAMGDAAAYLPCRNAGWQPYLKAESLRDIAESLDNPRQKAQKLQEALQELEKSEASFCSLGKQYIQNEIQRLKDSF